MALSAEMEQQVRNLMPQARGIAWKAYQRAPHALDLDELTSLAYAGLAQAAARWPVYCEEHGFDPGALQYFPAYAHRRARGNILDYLRSLDWVTRSVRGRMRLVRDAEQQASPAGSGETELAKATGLTKQQVREVLAAQARRPVSLDDSESDVPEEASLEGAVVLSRIQQVTILALDGLPVLSRVVIAMVYAEDLELPAAAAEIGISEEEVVRLHDEAVSVLHAAMAREAQEAS